MREIKFRAPDIKTGKLIYFGLGDIDGDYVPGISCFVDLEKAQQFTGLKDKNGREIYEGDIVRLDNYPGEGLPAKRGIKGPVVWMDDGFGISFAGYTRQWVYSIEVIGNIHENPELLK